MSEDRVHESREAAIADAMEIMRDGCATFSVPGTLYVCHGPPRCAAADDPPCGFCYRVDPFDRRPVEQILKEQAQ